MKDLAIIKSNLSEFLDILKAKKRNEGEVWTQPSGRKVTKKNGKIIPVSEGKKQPKGKNDSEKKPKEKTKDITADSKEYKNLQDTVDELNEKDSYLNRITSYYAQNYINKINRIITTKMNHGGLSRKEFDLAREIINSIYNHDVFQSDYDFREAKKHEKKRSELIEDQIVYKP